MSAEVVSATVFEDSSAKLMAYVTLDTAVAITVADIASMTYSVTQITDPVAGTGTVVTGHDNVSMTVATHISALVPNGSDAAWNDSRGYNFKHRLAKSAFPTGGVKYRYECKIVLTDGGEIPVVFELNATPLYRS